MVQNSLSWYIGRDRRAGASKNFSYYSYNTVVSQHGYNDSELFSEKHVLNLDTIG